MQYYYFSSMGGKKYVCMYVCACTHTHTHTHSMEKRIKHLTQFQIAQSAGAVEYTMPLSKGVRPPHQWVSWIYNTKQSDGEVPVMLTLRRMQSISSLPSLPDPLWPSVVVLDRVLSMSQIELNCIFMLNWIV